MKKLLIIPFFFFSLSVFGQFTKPELYNGINLNIRNKGASQKRLADMLDSIVVSMGSGGGSSLTLVDGNGTTVNGTGDGVDLGGTVNNDIALTPDSDETRSLGIGTVANNVALATIWGSFKVFGKDTGGFTSVYLGVSPYRIYSFSAATVDAIDLNSNNASQLYLQPNGNWALSGGGRSLGYNGIGFQLNLSSDATGDTYYRNSSGYFTRLAAGTNGHVLTLASGIPSWAAPSGITNSAANNELMKSNGTNAVASGIFSASVGSIELGTGLTGASRTVTATGTATNVGLNLDTKGAGAIVFKLNGSAQGAGIGAVTGQIALGISAGNSATGATYSNFFGLQAGQSATNATYCNFFGVGAGQGASGASNSNFFGREAGLNGSNVANSNFFGSYAGRSATNASSSNFFGQYAGQTATNASFSNFFGKQAGYLATSASYANFFGYLAGSSAASASYSNLFGYQAGMFFTGNDIGSNNIIIGTNISLGNAVANSMNIGGVLFGKGFYSTTTGNPSITAVAAGQIGIGQVTPTANTRLDVLGSGTTTNLIQRWADSGNTPRLAIQDNGVILVGTDAGTAGQVLTSQGSGSAPIWTAAGSGSIASGSSSYSSNTQGSVTLTASGSGTTALPIPAYGNKTILVAEIQFMAMKSDGTAAAFSTVTSMFRKDNSGTWTVDTAGTSTTSNAVTIVSITGAIGGGAPALTYTTGAYSGTYTGGFTVKLSSYQY